MKSGHLLESKSILKSPAIMRLSITVVLLRLESKEDNSTMKFIMEVYGGLYIPKSTIAFPLIVKLKAAYSKLTNAS